MPNNKIQSLTVNGVTYDIVDNTSGYINAQYIENKTDYSIPVSRVGEIVVGETAIGTDSTNFPTSKAVVDYVDERVVQEIDAIDVGVISVNGKTGSVTLSASDVGAITQSELYDEFDGFTNYIQNQIPASTSQLTNDSGFITSETDPTVPAWAKASTKPTYTAAEVGALPDSTVITDEKLKVNHTSDEGTYYPILTSNSTDAQTKLRYRGLDFVVASDEAHLKIGDTSASTPRMGKLSLIKFTYYTTIIPSNNGHSNIITLPNKTGTVALLDDIPTVPTNISSFTNDSGYLTASDIASVMTYKGTKANYAALPSTGNTTGDVWHLTDTGAEWAWDGSAWQELGTAIDLNGYVESSRTADSTTINFSNTGTIGSIQSTYQGTDNESYIQVTADENGAGIELYASDNNNNSNQMILGPAYTEIHNVISPIDDTDAANKKYVDDSIGALSIPTKTSDLTNDSGYLTSYTETDPTVPSWAKASSKPSYALTEISGTDDLRAIEALTGTSGLLKKTATNTWTLDTNTYLTSYTETDPTVPSWAKQSSKPTYTATEVGALPDTTTIPSKTSDLTNDSGFITGYTETDPIFSTSAASGITASDISNWNGKSSTDEKLAVAEVSDSSTYYPIFGSGTTAATRLYDSNGFKYQSASNTAYLSLGTRNNKNGRLTIIKGNYYKALEPTTLTNSGIIYLPDKDGTIALTSDIPTVPTKVSDLTNDSGFISSYTETDPVFSASAAAGITSTDISNWNGKSSTDEKVKQVSNTTSNAALRVLYAPNVLDTDYTGQVNKSSFFTYNPTTKALMTGGTVDGYTLAAACAKAVDTSISVSSSSANLPTSAAVANFVENKGYLTLSTLPIYDGTVV